MKINLASIISILNQNWVIIAILVAALLGLHIALVNHAVDKNNNDWITRIKNAPVKSDTVVKTIFVQLPPEAGSGTAVVDNTDYDSIDSLITECANKDSLIKSLAASKKAIFNQDSLGTLTIGYVPLKDLFTWSLTNRPPLAIKTITVDNTKMILVPFRTWGLSGSINGLGALDLGVKKRDDNWMYGVGYQVAGPTINNWYQKFRIDCIFFIW